jgi:hypothetical protein
MNCREFEEALSGALGGEQPPERASSHLRECGACRARGRQMLRLHEALTRGLAPYPESLDVEMKILVDQVAKDLRSPGTDLVEAARERIQRLPRRGTRGILGNWRAWLARFRRRAALAAAVGILGLSAWIIIAFVRPSSERPETAARGSLPETRKAMPARIDTEEVPRPAPERGAPRPKEEPARPEERRPERKPEEDPARPKPVPEAEPEKPREKVPEEGVPPPNKPPGRTVAKVGRLEKMKGSVFILPAASSEKVMAREGQDLVSGESIHTEGPGSIASVTQADSMRLKLESDTTLIFGSPTEVSLSRGALSIETAKAPPESTLSLSTAHARIQVGRGHFLLHARPDSTYFETCLGAAQFSNLQSGASVQVTAGQFAAAPVHPGVSQERIDKAIRDGIEYLKKAPSPPFAGAGILNSDTLILLTLLHAGVPDSDPRFQRLLQDMLKAPIDRTYVAAIQAMILEEIDRVRYQSRIVACAQVLIDNQCRNGQWSYGTSTPAAEAVFIDPRPDVATVAKLDASGRRVKPKLTKKVAIQKTKDGPAQGDNSNAQYAALGLRACFDAGVMIPAEVLHTASRWWRESQFADKEDRKNAYGGRGWCYHDGKGKVNGADCCRYTYAAMTSGAVGGLVVYDFMLGKDWKSDTSVRSGLEWLTTNFSVTRDFKWGKEIPGDPEDQGSHFYYLYALERLGTFTAQEKLGRHEWYSEGSAVIVEKQRPDGSWQDIELGNSPVWDTCYSILFLRRATRPLVDVASVDRFQKR